MNIPKKLKILGHDIDVAEVSPLYLNGDSGAWDNKRNIILINEDMPQSQKELTLFHEILHAINAEMSEEKIEFIAGAMHQVFSDNELLR